MIVAPRLITADTREAMRNMTRIERLLHYVDRERARARRVLSS